MLHRRRPRDRERGQILILFTLVVMVIFGFTAMVIDLGLLRNDRQQLANALDAGALAGGTLLPVDGSSSGGGSAAVNAINNRINREVRATFPGLVSGVDYQIEYRCLIGVVSGAPAISRDIPTVCNPRRALGHSPVPPDFIGAGRTRSSICNPALGDRCNAVVLRGAVSNDFTFGRAVGVNEGSTGTVVSAACNGPCGEPPFAPLDVVVIIDRTGSMAGDEDNLRAATRTVLSTYDSNVQHIALGALGPSTLGAFCQGTPNGRHGIPLDILPDPGQQPPDLRQDTSSTTTSSQLRISRPSSTGNLAGQFLIAGIAVDNAPTSLTITPPTGWNLIRRTNNGSNVSVASYYKYATANEPSDYTWTFGGNRRASGGVMRYTGVASSNPIVGDSGNTGNGDNLRANAVSTVADSAIVAFYVSDTNTDIDLDDMDDEAFETSPNNGPTIAGQYDEQNNAGSTGNRDADADDNAQWAAQLITLRPAPAPPVVQEYGTDVDDDIDKWILQGLTGTASGADVNEAYASNGSVVNSSRLARTIDCVTDEDNLSSTGTNLATPMRMATEWLREHGRGGDVKQGIIFESDGTPNYNGESGDPQNYRCDEAIEAAQEAKDAGIEVFTIAFDIVGERCPDSSKLATTAMAEMSSSTLGGTSCNSVENRDLDHFFCEPGGSDLSSVFQAAAAQLAGIRSHLVQIYPAPYVTSINPGSGNAAGGYNISIGGSGFTGATQVTFGGTPSPQFTVNSDTSITARVPSGTPGDTVHVRVTSPGGSSPKVDGDRFTYN